jgi:cytochrome c-type biogenesis protein CcmE
MAKRKSSKLSWLIGGGVVAVAALSTYFISMPGTMVYFFTPDEALAKASELEGKTVRIGGMVKTGTVKQQPEVPLVTFTLWDMKGSEIAVSYKGLAPDMFKESQGVVVEGRIDKSGQTMLAQNLLVKHSEEYKKPSDHSTMNKALLEKSLFK